MKIALIFISSLILAPIVAFFVLGLISQSGKANGLVDGKLTKCPEKPNCICTEFETDIIHYLDPVAESQSNTSEVMSKLKNSIREMGGSIRTEKGNYLAATFTSSFFKFVDDVEIRIDRDQTMIHMRSASRVGYSDGEINKKRIERLKILYNRKIE